jgi:hypothetical protein
MEKELPAKLRHCLNIAERQKILNNGCAGMRDLLFYLDSIANKIDKLHGKVYEKNYSKPKPENRKAAVL